MVRPQLKKVMLRCCVNRVLLLLLLPLASAAQGVHFSQFRLLPNLQNPAFTGFFDGDVRAGIVYRNQSPTYDNAFHTLGFGADISLLKQKRPSSILGLGLHGYYDRAGALRFTDNTLLLNFSYTQVLDKSYKYYLSFGLQAGYAFRTIDLSRAMLEESFNGYDGFYEGQITEPGILSKNRHFKLGSGVLFFAQPVNAFNVYIGGGVLDMARSNLSFIDAARFEQVPRYTFQFGSQIRVSERVACLPGFYMQFQDPLSEYVAGMLWQYRVISNTNREQERYAIGAGLNYRVRDAVILVAQVQYRQWKLNFAYDINVSKLRSLSRSVGGIEVALIYESNFFKDRKKPVLPMRCPQVGY